MAANPISIQSDIAHCLSQFAHRVLKLKVSFTVERTRHPNIYSLSRTYDTITFTPFSDNPRTPLPVPCLRATELRSPFQPSNHNRYVLVLARFPICHILLPLLRSVRQAQPFTQTPSPDTASPSTGRYRYRSSTPRSLQTSTAFQHESVLARGDINGAWSAAEEGE